jgi:hypothetical protein
MDKTFWQSIVQNDFRVPEGYTIQALTPQLLEMLASPDAELRDEVAYLTFARWIVRDEQYTPDALRNLIRTLTMNLKTEIIDQGENSSLLRSFSVLVLSLIAYYDIQKPFLSEEELRDLLEAGLDYLASERDLRGYVPGLGWVHATAHTADLLKFIARNPKSEAGAHLQILSGIADRLMQPVAHVYIHDEDERLTMAVVDALKRKTLTHMSVVGWLERFREWKAKSRNDGDFDPTIHAPYTNIKNFIRSLYFSLQWMAQQDEEYRELEQEALKVVRYYGMGTIYTS